MASGAGDSAAQRPHSSKASPRVMDSAAPKPSNSYAQILKSSSVIGGAQAVGYLISTVRTKLVAVLIGPSGVGLVGLYISATELVGNLARMGINESGVREVAEAHGSGGVPRIAHTAKTLRRVCWVTGILGWLLTAALAYPLSSWAFGSSERTWAIAALGVTTFFGAISGGQTALLQGTRRVSDIARLNVFGGAAATIIAAAIYALFRQRGIVPVLISTAAINLGLSWWLARGVSTTRIDQSWPQTIKNSKRLISLGLAFMWSALLGAAVGLGIRALIVREMGLDANGIYQAAWGISGMFGGLILGAMGTDFYPHLTATSHDHPAATRLVNEQTEIGLLLALPGLQATLAFAPWIMHVFFSAKFMPGAELLPWFVIGVLSRMITFPMGYILVAKGATGRYALITSLFHIINLGSCFLLLPRLGLAGIAIANMSISVVYLFGMRLLAGPLIDFSWSPGAKALMLLISLLAGAGFAAATLLPPLAALGVGFALTLASCLVCLRGTARRLGSEHRLVKLACRVPLGKQLCGI